MTLTFINCLHIYIISYKFKAETFTMEDDNSMCQRIFHTLESIFTNDPDLEEFTIIPAEINTKNKCPVLYEAHNIGLESWCVKHIYRYAYSELMHTRKQSRKIRDLNHLLIGALLINPDVSTFWNIKRELVEADVLDARSELTFAKILLTHKSKSNEAFAYRRWLLKRLLHKTDNAQTVRSLLESEMDICTKAGAKNPNNYHAWTHRIWCVENMLPKIDNCKDFMNRQLEFSHDWVWCHVSEHTGFHYRQYLFNTIRNNKNFDTILAFYYEKTLKQLNLINENDPRNILTFLLGRERTNLTVEQSNKFVNHLSLLLYDLFCTVDILNSVFPNHESIFYHRRYLIYNLVKFSYDYLDVSFKTNFNVKDNSFGENIVSISCGGATEPKLFKSQPNKVETTFLYKTLLGHESDFITKNSEQQHDLDLVRRYEKWLKFILNDV